MGILRNLFGRPGSPKSGQSETTDTELRSMSVNGTYKGKPVTDYVDHIKHLKRENKLDEARILLEGIVEATYSNADATRFVAAPWYTEQLAIVYRKLSMHDKELALLERYVARNENPGATGDSLRARLAKLKGLK